MIEQSGRKRDRAESHSPPHVPYHQLMASYIIVGGRAYAVKDCPAEIFSALIDPVLESIGHKDIPQTLRIGDLQGLDYRHAADRFYILNCLHDIGRPIKLYRTPQEALRHVA